ncbi:MAG: formate/nitrite transporter family protein [Gemmatimonadetes bacterium]|nr:formate/nitrite transporter family protein [Gemmatimonadota bacterium]
MPESEGENGSQTVDVHLRSTFQKSVDEGRARLDRSWLDLISTGLVGGIDVSLGVLALLVVEEATGSAMLGSLAFTIGFIALTLGKSELFTENFLVPVAAVVARKASVASLFRLWIGTAVMNLVAGWLFAWILVLGLPRIHETAIEVGAFYPAKDDPQLFGLGVLAGVAITLMTWMEHGAKSEFGKLVSVATVAFLLAAGPLNHIIVVSIEMFVAIETGSAGYGYAEWARVAGWATLSNTVGGLVLVTSLRFAQVGKEAIREERARDPEEPRE